MGTAAAYLKKLQGIDVDLAVKISLDNTKEYYKDQQKLQLFQGLERTDLKIIPSYSKKTIRIKQSKGQPYDRVTLRDTGSFYKGIRIDIVGEVIRIDSVDSKSEHLTQRYGSEIFGLGSYAKSRYIRILQPELIKQLKAFLK